MSEELINNIQEEPVNSRKRESNIESFRRNNPKVEIDNSTDGLLIKNCWGEDISFLFQNNDTLETLSDITMPTTLLAIFHRRKKEFEFIYAPLQERIDRKFSFLIGKSKYEARFDKPSKKFENLSKRLVLDNLDFDSDRLVHIFVYHKYYSEYEKDLIPTNFFVKGPFDIQDKNQYISVLKHLNVLMSYYDRKNPRIMIYEEESDDDFKITIPNLIDNSSDFPAMIRSEKVFESVPLDLFQAAADTKSTRLKFLYYFQILEYYTYYYFDKELERQIKAVISNPDILVSNEYAKKIIDIIRTDATKKKDDSTKLTNLVNDFVDPEDIQKEIASNIDVFSTDVEFEGGFVAKKFVSDIDNICTQPNLIENIAKKLEKIRNVLVHARETRENIVIAPSNQNSIKLLPYLYLIKRIAEIVTIRWR